jgi:hypothetical protein
MVGIGIHGFGRSPLYLDDDGTILDPLAPAFFVFFILVVGDSSSKIT